MITLREVRKSFSSAGGDFVALDGINLEITKGSIHGIIGPSGAGKTTLMRCICGLTRVSSGEVNINGTDITKLRLAQLRGARRLIGMVSQNVDLFEQRTALANLLYPMKIAGYSTEQRNIRARELLELVGLGDRADYYPAQLSGGQRQRVGIARGLATEAPILLCDEPSSALDWDTTRQILELIAELRERLGITVVIITHEMSVVRQVCDSVSLIRDGKIAETGQIAQLLANHATQLSRELIPLASTQPDADTVQYEVAYSTLNLSTAQVLGALAEVAGDAAITSGTMETLAGQSVGRFQLGIQPGREQLVLTVLERVGLQLRRVTP